MKRNIHAEMFHGKSVKDRKILRNNTKCCVQGCNNTSLNNSNLSFHLVPPSKRDFLLITSEDNSEHLIDVRDLWIDKLKIGRNIKKAHVCSNHFAPEDFATLGNGTERRKLKRHVFPRHNLPGFIVEDYRNTVSSNEAHVSPSFKGSTSPFQPVDLATGNNRLTVTPEMSPFISPGTTGSTSKFKVNGIYEERDAIKCNLQSLFDAVNEVSCGNKDCHEILSSEELNEEPILHDTTNKQDVLETADVGIQVDSGSKHSPKKFVSVGTQVTSGDIYVPFSSRIKTDHALSVMCGIRNHQLLDKLVSLTLEIYPEQRKHKMPLRERIFMTTMKLKNDLKFSVLTLIFNCVAESTCRAIFLDTLQKLARVLRSVICWVPKEEILRNMPTCFENFEDTVCVVDCTEFRIQTPKCLACRLKVYSHYKSNFTVKFMTAVSPGGLLMYLSPAYGGRSSDGAIFEDSNIMNKLQPGDAVMADKGFKIENLCNRYSVNLHRPPFLEMKKQFSSEEALLNRRIAAARVHVERMNQRIEVFDVLKNEISWNLLNYVDDIVVVCSGLANLGTPILADDKFM